MIKGDFKQERWGGLVCTNIREILSAAADAGLDAHKIAEICGIQPTSLSKWRRDNRARGHFVQPLLEYLNKASVRDSDKSAPSTEMQGGNLACLIGPLEKSIVEKAKNYLSDAEESNSLPVDELEFLKLLRDIQ